MAEDCKYCRTTPNGGEVACATLKAAHECPWMTESDWNSFESKVRPGKSFQEIERRIVDYFETAGGDVEQDGLEWFLSLYDEGPSISLTALAVALTSKEHS